MQEARVADVFVNPTPEELRRFTEEMPECRITEFGNVNVQTQALSRSAGSTFVVDRASSGKTMTREALRRDRPSTGRVHRERRHDPDRRMDRERPDAAHPRPSADGEALREHRRHAAEALLRPRRRRGARGPGDLHAGTPSPRLPRRSDHRRRPRPQRHARPQLRLLRRVEEGRPADVEQHRLRQGRPRAARGAQGDPDRRGRQGLHDHRALRHREDDDDVHHAERLEADPGRLRGPDAGRARLRNRERVLREDLLPRSRVRAVDLRSRHQAHHVSGERLPG